MLPHAFLDGLDHVVFDCDGVVYVGQEPVPGITDVLAEVRRRDLGVLFVTNDMTRSSADIARQVRSTGAHAAAAEVLHAGRAAALYHAHHGHSHVLVAGNDTLCAELEALDIRATRDEDWDRETPVDAVLVGGYDGLAFTHLDVLLQAWRPGMDIVACNLDRTFPGPSGPRLGCGSVAASLAYATGAPPVSVGKPSPILFEEARELLGPGRIGIIGDTLMSDIAGANAAGWRSAWLRHDGAPRDHHAEPDVEIADLRQLLGQRSHSPTGSDEAPSV